ncbi:Ricin B lectin [Streptomyces sp. CB02488]|uniref:RICIN domain-containing protein n=1 Tax=Streptomyces sp. CB02488 TaxID=1703920 RepID=UPI0009402E4F|nr:RICIN domain-containing protein [Streptomyces sp. CB02488]OKK17048.1 Ricin B lectin [Streptomyces sp. CB02488]
MSVRRAVTMQGAAGDPGDALAPGGALTPGGGRSGGTDASSTGPTTNSTARTPSPPSNGPENEGPVNEGPENKGPENEGPENQDPGNEDPENQDPEGKDSGEETAERTNAGEATGTAEGGAAAIGAPEAPSTAPDATGSTATGQAEPSASSVPASPESSASASASTSAAATASTSSPSAPDPTTGPTAVRTVGAGPDEAVAAGAAGSGGAGANAHADGEPPSSRPKKPMLAAAAIVGAILIAVPFLVAGQDDREPEQTRTQNAAGTLLGSERSIVPDTYTSESPSPSVKPSKKVKEKEKQAPPPAPQQTLTPSPSASEKAKVKPKKKPKPKVKELTGAEKLRRWANGRSGVQNTVIRNASTSQCVDIANYGKGKPTAPVNQYPCNATTADNQLWSLDIVHKSGGPQNAPVFLIRNTKDGLCLDVGYYDARPAGSKVSEFNCRATGDNQLWWLDPRGDGTNWIRNVVSNDLCLRPTGGASAGNDARLVIAQCGAGDHWIV